MSVRFSSAAELREHQETRLRALWGVVFPANRFYATKLGAAADAGPPANLEEFTRRVPFTVKSELSEDQRLHPPYGSNLSFPLSAYTRCHQTSGTSGEPLRWLDTPASWQWLLDSWCEVYRAAAVDVSDRILFAFSFGPFIGFWMAFEAAERLGCLCLAGGGFSSSARLALIRDHGITVLCCTPTYALHLAESARAEGMDLGRSAVKRIIVAGEPGGSIPATRQRLEQCWPGARIVDHHGMTEVGPVTYECPETPGVLHVNEGAYFAEVVVPGAGEPVSEGAQGELILTTLGREGSPLLRYRTGDLVCARPRKVCACGRLELALQGGILGRTDDMVIVRGVNIYPGAVEEQVRAFPEVEEFRVEVATSHQLAELRIEIECRPESDGTDVAQRLERRFMNTYALRIPVRSVPPGSLPRFEMKARRWVRRAL